MGWILETNAPMNRAMEGMGGDIKRRYRVYERGSSDLMDASAPRYPPIRDGGPTPPCSVGLRSVV
jgi:hypothetical protein